MYKCMWCLHKHLSISKSFVWELCVFISCVMCVCTVYMSVCLSVCVREQCSAHHPWGWGDDESDGSAGIRATQPAWHPACLASRRTPLHPRQWRCHGDGHQAEDHWDPPGERHLVAELYTVPHPSMIQLICPPVLWENMGYVNDVWTQLHLFDTARYICLMF